MEKRLEMILYKKKHQPVSHKFEKNKEFNHPLILSRSIEGRIDYSLHPLNIKPVLISLKENLARMNINLDLANVCIRSNSGTIYNGPLRKYNPDQSIDSCTIKNIPEKSERYPKNEIKIQLTSEERKTKYIIGFNGTSENEGLVYKVIEALNVKF